MNEVETGVGGVRVNTCGVPLGVQCPGPDYELLA